MLRGVSRKQIRPANRIYLDWASAAPVSMVARKAFNRAIDSYANPSSLHAMGAEARAILEEARKSIARLAAVKADGVIFTSGATEANALAIQGHVQAHINAGKKIQDLHVLYLPTAHASIVETMEALRVHSAQVEPLAVKNGAVDLVALKNQLRSNTIFVSMDVICGETGTKWATRDVRRVIDAYYREQTALDHSLTQKSSVRPLLHVDASQAPFVDSINLSHLGADLMTLDAQKVGGIRGIGALIRAHTSQAVLPLAPIMQGGGQEYGLRPGTENPALARAFAAALREADGSREAFIKRASEARAEILTMLTTTFGSTDAMVEHAPTPKRLIVNQGKESSAHILNISFIGRDTDYAVMLLSKAGFAISTKSACETDTVGSRVVLALLSSYDASRNGVKASMGDTTDRALSTLRISWGPLTKLRELRKFAKELIRTIQFLDAHSL